MDKNATLFECMIKKKIGRKVCISALIFLFDIVKIGDVTYLFSLVKK